MGLNSLNAVSPIDGRYHSKTAELSAYYSEEALIKYRVKVEIEYFIALCDIPIPQLKSFDHTKYDELRTIYREFSTEDAQAIKDIEAVTNHDVKAVEYFIKGKFDEMNLQEYKEFIHFGLTSQDINNTAIPLSLRNGIEEVYLPAITELIEYLHDLANDWKNIPLLARTHGQPASPTLLGKEIMVFIERLNVQIDTLEKVPFSAKFGGATGNFNAHYAAYPDYDWNGFAKVFVNDVLGLNRSFPTTQIEHYDNMAALFDALKRINSILIDLDRDMWTYVSMEYFKQKIKKGEVGSSAMPHKVNPIDFENSEGNLGMANAIFEHLSAKLPISRLQRDLTDSTVLRNIGVPIAHSLIAIKSTMKGMKKMLLNTDKLAEDLENNWAVVAEAIQTVLRREQYPNPYEALKGLTRKNEKVTAKTIADFIETLDVSEEIKAELRVFSPSNYVGK
ncbi:MAG: adenylosuccinate lyase [Ichthyobacteriaceae bacterium]|nr:adenylosuccinate lyase [Ichthyobacteriaceae bacterium]